MAVTAASADTREVFNEVARVYVPVGGVVLIAVVGLLIWVVVRDRNGRRRTPSTRTTNPALEIGYIAVLTVVAAKWNWRFEYPGGVAQVGNGVKDPATLVVPSGGAVRFRLTTIDVEHAFWIPEARYKFARAMGMS